MPRALTIEEAQADLDHVVDAAQEEPIALTRGGQVIAILSASEDRPRTGLAAYIKAFRAGHDLVALNTDEVFADVRDRSPGRDVLL